MAQLISPGDFMVANDLDSGYWHVPIHPEHYEYLSIHFVHDDGSVVFFCWKVVALGLKDAAFIFTQLTKPIMAGLRLKGFRCCIYINDKLTICQEYENCLR